MGIGGGGERVLGGPCLEPVLELAGNALLEQIGSLALHLSSTLRQLEEWQMGGGVLDLSRFDGSLEIVLHHIGAEITDWGHVSCNDTSHQLQLVAASFRMKGGIGGGNGSSNTKRSMIAASSRKARVILAIHSVAGLIPGMRS